MRSTKALSLALTVSALSSLRLCWQASAVVPNEVPLQRARFANVMATLPDHGVIGYFSDRQYETPLPSPPYQAKYVFAPRMLVWFPNPAVPEWVIGDFMAPQDYAGAGKQLGLQLVRNFGGGVVLYRR
jgi:hypothetical protein